MLLRRLQSVAMASNVEVKLKVYKTLILYFIVLIKAAPKVKINWSLMDDYFSKGHVLKKLSTSTKTLNN